MKRSLPLIVLFLGGMATGGAQAPALPTVDQVLDKYVAAVGGRAALEKVTSVTARGTLEIADLQISGTIELFQKADRSLQVVNLTGVGLQREGFDGAVAWAEDPQNGVREKSGAELAEARRGAMFPRELKMKQQYPTMAVTGRERVGARDAVVILATPADGAPARLYFDAESGLMVRQVITRQSPGGPVQIEVTFDDYRVVDGVKRAHTIRQVTPQFAIVAQLSDVKQNVPIEDAVFRKPG